VKVSFGRRAYDLAYRLWAPWDVVGIRPELQRMVEEGALTPTDHPNVIDLGCGSGANSVFLAAHGFQVTAVDFSPAGLHKAERRAVQAGVAERCRFVEADLTAPDLRHRVGGPFDLLIDASTLDDLTGSRRTAMAENVARLARPGAVLLCWCNYTTTEQLPRFSFTRPSRLVPVIEPGEEQRLFGAAFDIEIERPPDADHEACLLLRRRSGAS
jgi:ubiquinone/menaquinone biosynthesis C-methylase UbiE